MILELTKEVETDTHTSPCVPLSLRSLSDLTSRLSFPVREPISSRCSPHSWVPGEEKKRTQRRKNSIFLRVPLAGEECTPSITIDKPPNLHYQPEKMLHPLTCLLYVTLPKDHPEVKGSPLGARALQGILFGNNPNSPRFRANVSRDTLARSARTSDKLTT
jgi:hypothetical protein